ncbi:MAG TPA: sterol desaturase family protein [Myxococcaceae bacterium]|nr:sterol desaturase family protein [Myxococcaceae bacterium]
MKRQYHRHASGRLFENAFLERSSRVKPVTPFVFYIPIIVVLQIWALWNGKTTWMWTLGMWPVGWVAWQWMEYVLHRSLFHWEGNGPLTRKFHAIIHGYHHDYPDDLDRLVMPLGASIPLAVVIAGLLWLVGQPQATIPFFVGLVAGYLWYDYLHYSVHARAPRTKWGKGLRAHHMAHHFNTPDKNFGISHLWIDKVMGSMRQRPARNTEPDAAQTSPPAAAS